MVTEAEAWLIGTTLFGVFVAIGAVIVNSIWQRKGDKLQREHYEHVKDNDKKNLHLRGLSMVFELMSDKTHREAREKVVTAYYDFLVKNNLPKEYTIDTFEKIEIINIVDFDKSVRPYLEIVKADFSQIAVMIHHELLDPKAFDDAFWGTTLRCYAALRGNIGAMKKIAGIQQHATKFQKQCEERTLPYWREKHPDSTIKFYRHNDKEPGMVH